MFIQTESTPNPATLKFLPGQNVLEVGTADFPSAEAASKSPLAGRIFAVDGVAAVFFGIDFVTVTKTDAVEWDHIKPAILGAIMEHYQSGAPVIEGEQAASGHAEHTGEDGEIVNQINADPENGHREPSAPLHPRGGRGSTRRGLNDDLTGIRHIGGALCRRFAARRPHREPRGRDVKRPRRTADGPA